MCLSASDSYQVKKNIDDDPVIRAYWECLNQNLLCTWRRQPRCEATNSYSEDPTPTSDSLKELWVFYYSSEQPKCIDTFTSSGGLKISMFFKKNIAYLFIYLFLVDQETEYEQKKKYHIRTLLFKALHAFIERKFLKIGYIRFGRWFTKPLEEPVVVNCQRSLPQ